VSLVEILILLMILVGFLGLIVYVFLHASSGEEE